MKKILLKKKKIIFFINTITTYQDEFFIELKKYYDVNVIFYHSEYKNYNFNISIKKKNYFFLNKINNKFNRIANLIEKINPDYTIFGGYKLPYIDKIIEILKKKQQKYFFWLERLNQKNILKFRLVSFLIKKKIKSSSGVLAVGHEAEKFYKKFNRNVLNLPYSIKINNCSRRIYFDNNKINFIFVGQIIKRKGIDLILDVFDLLENSEKKKIILRIIGNGILQNKINSLKKKNNFIKYSKFKNKEDLIKIYSKSDVFIFPSRFDGWGVAALEAMSSAEFLIISKYVGMKEILGTKNKITETSIQELLKAVKEVIKKKLIIEKVGRTNQKILKKSLSNIQNSTKHLFNFLNKINK